MSQANSRLIFSTDKVVQGKGTSAEKGLPVPVLRTGQQRVIVRLDRKGRGGKSVTVIEGLRISIKEKEVLLKRLKSELGTGGTVKGDTLEIQGDHCGTIMTGLEKLGYRPKRSGS